MSRQPLLLHTFILRIWLEPRGRPGEVGEWRGRLEHVPSGRKLSFRHLEGLNGALKEFLEAEPTP